MKTEFLTRITDNVTHCISDGGMVYWTETPGATNDEVAEMFRDGYDGTPEPFTVTDLTTDESDEYAA